LNTLYYREQPNWTAAMTLGGKVRFLKEVVFSKPGDLLILGISVYSVALLGVEKTRGAVRTRLEVPFLLLCLPFLFIGSLAATPSWYQYFFAPMPFILMLALYGLASFSNERHSRSASVLLVILALISVADSGLITKAGYLRSAVNGESWSPLQLHREATEIAILAKEAAKPGKVLTLAPLYAVEARLSIYASFVTSPFAWRVSTLLSTEARAERSIVGPAEIKSLIEKDPPIAILTGTEKEDIEMPLIEAAKKLGYVPITTSGGIMVWISPR
jgi:hypothetical protein